MNKLVLLLKIVIITITTTNYVYGQKSVSPKEKKGKWALTKGKKKVTEYIYENIKNNYNDYYIAQLNSKWGVLNDKGQSIVPFDYEEIEDLLIGRLKVKKSSLYGIIDTSGYSYSHINFEAIDNIALDSTILVKKNNEWFYIKNNLEIMKETLVFKNPDMLPIYGNCMSLNETKKILDCSKTNLLNEVFENLEYPEDARKNKVSGMVVVSFVISDKGELGNFKIRREIGYGCGEEAIRAVKKLGVWKPGIKDGIEVNTEFILPVRFKLQ